MIEVHHRRYASLGIRISLFFFPPNAFHSRIEYQRATAKEKFPYKLYLARKGRSKSVLRLLAQNFAHYFFSPDEFERIMESVSLQDLSGLFPNLFETYKHLDPTLIVSALETAQLDEQTCAAALAAAHPAPTPHCAVAPSPTSDENARSDNGQATVVSQDSPSNERPKLHPPVEEFLAFCFGRSPADAYSEKEDGRFGVFSMRNPSDRDGVSQLTQFDDTNKWYLVRFVNASYGRCAWIQRSVLLRDGSSKTRLRNFDKKRHFGDVSVAPFFNPDYLKIDRILAHKNGDSLFVKWRGLGYERCTWEDEDVLEGLVGKKTLERAVYWYEKDSAPPSSAELLELRRSAERCYTRGALSSRKDLDEYPPQEYQGRRIVEKENEDGTTEEIKLKLRDYQLAGLDWLRFSWECRRNVILADEMGLGKTAQSIALLQWLRSEKGLTKGPFLIVAPRSCVEQWKREIETWTDMCVLLYVGNTKSRKVCNEHDFYLRETGQVKFDCLVTSYETIDSDHQRFKNVGWQYTVIDEGHRLKNESTQASRNLRALDVGTGRLLLTGTPVQNNVGELWALLNFLHPEKESFSDKERFVDQFGDMTDASEMKMLHALIGPYILRREKGDVVTSLKPLEETVVYVEPTPFQKRCYRAIFEVNANSLLQHNSETKQKPNLVSIQSALRLCCSHPFLVKGVEESEVDILRKRNEMEHVQFNKKGDGYEGTPEMITKYSGKLVLLAKLLAKLEKEGHRVLIFSFFKVMLDMVEYAIADTYTYERLDGDTSGGLRQAAMDRFQKKNGAFCFLLTTRAGGVGLNLQAADTVIMLDSDWNPQNDLQARARCHRIGQTKNVSVYRLVTRRTYEEEIFNRANRKLGLERAVNAGINSVGASTKDVGPSNEEIERLLRVGAYQLQADDDDKAASEFERASIEDILASSSSKTTTTQSVAGGSFAVANFTPAGAEGSAGVDVDDPDFWNKIGFLKKAADAGKTEGDLAYEQAIEEQHAAFDSVGRRTRRGKKGVQLADDDDGLGFAVLEPMDDQLQAPFEPNVQMNAHERRRLETQLLKFGMNRLDTVRKEAKLENFSKTSVEAYARCVVSFCKNGLSDSYTASLLEKELYAENYVAQALVHDASYDPETEVNDVFQVSKIPISDLRKIKTIFSTMEGHRYIMKGSYILNRLRLLAIAHAEIYLSARRDAQSKKAAEAADASGESDDEAMRGTAPLSKDWWNSSLSPFHAKDAPLPPALAETSFRSIRNPKKLKSCPMWNANGDQDSCLLLGIHKYGWNIGADPENFADLRLDERLGFFNRLKLRLENDDENAADDDDEMTDLPEPLKNSPEDVEARWPQTYQLNKRIEALCVLLEKERKKQVNSCDAAVQIQKERQMHKDATKAIKLARAAKKEREARRKRALMESKAQQRAANPKKQRTSSKKDWNAADVKAFVRAHRMCGEWINVGAVQDRESDRTKPFSLDDLQFRGIADKMNTKSEAQIAEFYNAFLFLVEENTGGGAHLTAEVSESNAASRDAALVDSLRKNVDFIVASQVDPVIHARTLVRSNILSLLENDGDNAILRKKWTNLEGRPKHVPKWWVPQKHDVELLKGVLLFGMGETSFDDIWQHHGLCFLGMDKDFDYVVGRARNMTYYPKYADCVGLLKWLCE